MGEKSFLALPQPIVCGIAAKNTVTRDIAAIRNAECDGAAAFAVHMEKTEGFEHISDEDMQRLTAATEKPVMLLYYRMPKDTPALTDEDRVEVLKRAVRCGAAAVDLTADTYLPSPTEYTTDAKAVDRQKKAVDEIHSLGGEVIISSHTGSVLNCEQVLERMKNVENRGADIAKIVNLANTEEDFLECLKTTLALRREMKIPFIHLVGGKFATLQRFVSPMLGNMLTFCVDRYTEDQISNQPPVKNMVSALRNIGWHI